MEGNIKAVKQMQFVEVLKNRKNQIVDNHSMFALTILEKKPNNLAIYTTKRKEEAKVKLTNTQLKKIKFAGKIGRDKELHHNLFLIARK